MADYYPLLARALDALPDRSPGLRRAVYDRARNALISQLRSLEPPLSEADIDLERRALDAAIERLEVEHGGIPAPANDAAEKAAEAAPPPSPPPPPPKPEPAVDTAPKAEPAVPEPEPAPPPPSPPAEPILPPASSPRFVLTPEPTDTPPREAAIAIAARKPAGEAEPEPAPSAPVAPLPELAPVIDEPDASADGNQGRQRPRIAVVAPRSGRSRILRNLLIGVLLIGVIGAIAVAAYLLRDTPQLAGRAAPETLQPSAESPETKFNDRVGGEVPAAETPRPKPDSTPSGSQGQLNPAAPVVAVAQRAILVEEPTGSDSAQPTSSAGRVTWKLDTANGEQGQPLQTTAVATVNFPDAGLALTMTIQKNLDSTLPASHTVSLSFSQTGPGAGNRSVQDVGLLQAKDDENSRGSPVSGLPVRVRDNLFLIGLSSLPSDVERNTDLLLHRTWFDIAVRYTTGKRAVLTFEKGQSGAQVLQQAFEAWK